MQTIICKKALYLCQSAQEFKKKVVYETNIRSLDQGPAGLI